MTSTPPADDADRKKTAGKRKPGTDARGRFAPGNGGGPGRPRGRRNRVSELVEELLEGQAEQMTRKLISKALAGSTDAMKIAFAIMAPPRKDRPIEIALPPLTNQVAAHDAVIGAVAEGQISAAEGHALAGLLDLRRRAVETMDIEARLAALEARLGNSSTKPGG
jgi:hypothetical protein